MTPPSDEITALRAIAAFLIAGAYVATMVRVAERFGTKLGGLLISLPSTVLVGLVFIAVTGGQSGLHDASGVMPVTIAAACVFLTVFVGLSRWGLAMSAIGAVAIWLAITVPVAVAHLQNFWLALLICGLFLAVGVRAFRHVPHRTTKMSIQSWRVVFIRFVVAGGIAAATVIVARFAGPTWAAVCTSFPAVFSASLFLMVRSHGTEFTASLGRTMIVGCMANVVLVVLIHTFSSWIASGPTILLAYVCTLTFGLVSYQFLIERLGSTRATEPAVDITTR